MCIVCCSSNTVAYVQVIDLGDLGGVKSEAYDVNDSGVVVGNYKPTETTARAFRWNQGVMEDLGDLLGFTGNSDAKAINNVGQIAGTYSPDSGLGGERAFFWDETAGMQDIVGENTRGRGINVSGDVVGWGETGSFIWSAGAVTSVLGDRANDISNSGQVVGEQTSVGTFVWEGGTPTVLPVTADDHDINNYNEIVAGSFIYRKQLDQWEPTQIVPPSGSTSEVIAFGINDLSQVVGRLGHTSNTESRAFFWEEGIGVVDLNDLIDPNSGWILTDARAINVHGDIVGWGVSTNGETHAYMMRVPEPGVLTVAMCMAAGGTWLVRRRVG